MRVINLLKENKTLVSYFLLTYLDKGLYFILPIVVLYFTGDSKSYNDIEYICSLTNIVIPFLTFVACYSFFGYKESSNSFIFTKKYLVYSNITTLIIGVICLLLSCILDTCGLSIFRGIGIFFSIRTMFYMFVQGINCYYRLIDKPVKSLIYSIVINLLSMIAVIILCLCGNTRNSLLGFFIPELCATVFICYFIYKERYNVVFGEYISFLAKSVKYSWPIVINSTAVAFVANYGKVYAYNYLADSDMYTLSFLLRIVMIIEMAHASLISFFSKELYCKGYTKKFVITYSFTISITIIGVSIMMFFYNYAFAERQIPLNETFLLIIVYAVLHMLSAVLEIDYGRLNKNIYIFVISSIACAFYLLMIFFIGINGINTISVYMVIYMLIYTILLFCMRRRIR